MTLQKKPTSSKAATAEVATARPARLAVGLCQRIVNGKRHGKPVPTDHPTWSWCRACITEHHAAKKAASAKVVAPKARKRPAAKPLPAAYASRVLELEAEGMTTSDAQGAADVEFGLVSPATARAKRENR